MREINEEAQRRIIHDDTHTPLTLWAFSLFFFPVDERAAKATKRHFEESKGT
jgi:hypothetical protein